MTLQGTRTGQRSQVKVLAVSSGRLTLQVEAHMSKLNSHLGLNSSSGHLNSAYDPEQLIVSVPWLVG